MFLFSCCTSGQGQYAYEIRQNYQKVSKVSNGAQLQQRINASKQYLIKIKKSNYQDLRTIKQKWTDQAFPPNKKSLGDIEEVSSSNWKRLSEIINKPSLFSSNVRPNHLVKQTSSDNYFLSAVSALLQDPKKIKEIFVNKEISQNCIYCVKLRVNGNVQEIVIDDYVPVNQLGEPIFTSPFQSQIWLPLLEKAWAKINGSYANIINGNPSEVFKALNFAPSQIFYLQDKQQKKQKLWKLLISAVNRKSPATCATSHSPQADWTHLNLIPNHRYTLLYAGQVSHTNKNSYRILKLRDTHGKANWEGKGSVHDKQFWDKVLAGEDKIRLTGNISESEGELLMLYTDFVKYFSQINISYQLQQGNFIWEDVFFNGKNGSFWQISITHQGQYCFQLHQQSLRNKPQSQQQKYYCRSTILLAKIIEQPKPQSVQYEYISGSMRYSEQDVLVNANLKPGRYIIYAKIDAQQGNLGYHNQSSISCYSNKICKFRLLEKKNCENFLQKLFLNYGRQNKRQEYNNKNMWLSWKLLFKECGFAYIAFGNSSDSDKKFTVKFQSKDFETMHFKLKSPFKLKKGEQSATHQIIIKPGEQKIILARVINNRTTTLKFPPPLQMRIQELNPA